MRQKFLTGLTLAAVFAASAAAQTTKSPAGTYGTVGGGGMPAAGPATPAPMPGGAAPLPGATPAPLHSAPIPPAGGHLGPVLGGHPQILFGGGCNSCAPACGPKCECPPPGRFWATGEWLYWTTQGASIPPLVTGSPAGTPRAQAGVLGAPGTSILFGDERINDDFVSGFRATAGFYLDDCGKWGIGGSFFFLGNQSEGFAAGSDGSRILARPFFNAATSTPDAQLVSADSQLVGFPGVLAGNVNVDSDLDLYGFDVNVRRLIACGAECGKTNYRVYGLAGYRFLNLEESLTITENLTALTDGPTTAGGLSPIFTAGTNFVVRDSFATNNDFHGGQIGFDALFNLGSKFYINAIGKVALGVVNQEVIIAGSTTTTPPGTTLPGGLLAQPTNIGSYEEDEFAVVPEGTIRLGYRVTDNASLFVGYNFLYISNVARPGDQIDLTVNSTQIPPGNLTGVARPAFFGARDTDFWAQGVSVGAMFTF